jgi:hypothetical protein
MNYHQIWSHVNPFLTGEEEKKFFRLDPLSHTLRSYPSDPESKRYLSGVRWTWSFPGSLDWSYLASSMEFFFFLSYPVSGFPE